MRITQLRNATVLLDFNAPTPVRLLVDPMLAPRGALPTLKWLTTQRQRNPLVDLPDGTQTLLDGVTHALITHCQRGHFDHLDGAGKKFLRERKIPVLCTAHDAPYLTARGLLAQVIGDQPRAPFFNGHISTIACAHGTGWIAKFMEHGVGYFIDIPGEPTVYIAGDTVLTMEVTHAVKQRRPDISILPAGGAKLDAGAEILMDAKDVMQVAAWGVGTVIANHLEALDHCPVSRQEMRSLAVQHGVENRLLVPDDGQSYEFTTAAASVVSAASASSRQ